MEYFDIYPLVHLYVFCRLIDPLKKDVLPQVQLASVRSLNQFNCDGF